MTLRFARTWISAAWLSSSGLLLLLISMQTLFGKYPNDEIAVWAWALPTVIPTSSLILAVLSVNAIRPSKTDHEVEPLAFWTTLGICGFYFVLLFGMLLLQPLITSKTPLEMMTLSNLWLGPLQGIITAALTIFFILPDAREPQ